MKKSLLSTYLLYIVLGAIMVFWPDTSLKIACYGSGLVFIITGVMRLYAHNQNKNDETNQGFDFIIGVIACLFGLFLIVSPVFIVSLLPFVLGAFILINGVTHVMDAFQLKKANYEKWNVVLLVSLIMVLVGVVIMFNPFQTVALTVMIIGIATIVSGIDHLWSIHKLQNLNK